MEDESENSLLLLPPWVPEAASCDHPENKQDRGFEKKQHKHQTPAWTRRSGHVPKSLESSGVRVSAKVVDSMQGDPPVHSEGDQPWDFFGGNDAKAETPVLWPPHVKS